MTTEKREYPVSFPVEYPTSSSRLLALLGFAFWLKLFLLLPHIIVLSFLSIISLLVLIIGYIAVLLTGHYPRSLFGLQTGIARWDFRTSCWFVGLTDKYPPFSLKEGGYPTDISIEYPESSSRFLALLGLLLIKPLALIPHILVLYFLGMLHPILMWIGFIIVLVTGRYPRGLFEFVLGIIIWDTRVNCWFTGLTDKYPPFSLR